MDTKSYLSQIRRFDMMIPNKLEEIHQMRVMLGNVTHPTEENKVQKTPERDKIGVLVARIVDMESMVDEMIDKRHLIVSQIENMAELDKYNILAKRYILGKSIKEISYDSRKSVRQILRLHAEAVSEFEEIYGQEYL